jgi:hypothetical protein
MRKSDLPGIMFIGSRIEISGIITKVAESRDAGGSTVTKACLIPKGMIRKPDGSSGPRIFAIDLEIWGKLGKAFSDYVAIEVPVVVAGWLQLPSVPDQWEHEGGSLWVRLLMCVDDWQFLFPQLLPEDAVEDDLNPVAVEKNDTVAVELGVKQQIHLSQAPA